MELTKLLYVSRSTIPQDEAADSLSHIVETAHIRNPTIGLTGALLFTGEHFAQVMEGDATSIDMLMADIRLDKRHERIKIVHHAPLEKRRFDNWSLAYSGPSQFVSGHVTRLLNDPPTGDNHRAGEWLDELLCEFSAGLGARLK